MFFHLKFNKKFKGRIQMWIDIFPVNSGDLPTQTVQITPRKPIKFASFK